MRRSIALTCLLSVACSNSATVPNLDAGEDAADMEMDAGEMDAAMEEEEFEVEPPAPVCEGDTDPLNARFEIETVDIPRTMDDPYGIGGFNIDTLISRNSTVPGCGVVDEPVGIDNAFAYTAATISRFAPLIDPGLDLYTAVNDMIELGLLSISFDLLHWNGELNDEAVGVLITIESGSLMQESIGCGRMTNGVLEGRFDLPVALTLNAGSFSFSLQLKSARIRLALSEDRQSLDLSRSYLGGYILWDDGTAVTLPGELRAQIEAIIPSNISPALVKIALDLIKPDIDGYPELGLCVAAPTRSGVSADSMSIGLRLGGTRTPVAMP